MKNYKTKKYNVLLHCRQIYYYLIKHDVYFLPVVVNNNNTSNNKRPLGCRQIYYLQNNNKQDAKESDPSFYGRQA